MQQAFAGIQITPQLPTRFIDLLCVCANNMQIWCFMAVNTPVSQTSNFENDYGSKGFKVRLRVIYSTHVFDLKPVILSVHDCIAV